MSTLLDYILATALIILVGLPVTLLFDKWKKEMDEDGEE